MIVLPVPKKLEEKNGTFRLGLNTAIVMDSTCPQGAYVYAQMLKEEIAAWAGLSPRILRGEAQTGDIRMQVDNELFDEQYRVEIGENSIMLCGGTLTALGYAVQTLRQIVRQYAGLLPQVQIKDEPDLKNRGFYHDLTRGRIQTLENLKKLVDVMAFYKLNQLQLYVEHTYLFRNMTELWRDDTPMTAEEVLELDQYCYDRGIELVPSLSTFGHLYKLLSTKSYSEYCELADSEETGRRFSFRDRMDHHTVNVSHPNVMNFIKGMIKEYMQLFRTDKFNICADETFDLGKGRSKELADEKGLGNLYVDYIMELFDFLVEHGRKPMFWGDIICKHPELVKRIPEGTVCLNWGYSESQPDTETRILHDGGAVQYLCPGVRGWNTWMNLMKGGYENIRLMCGYARKYDAIGVLNTDWGDFGHINQPVFSIPGLIYGAVFSWGDCTLDYEELSRQISVLEFGDSSGRLVDYLEQVCHMSVFDWWHAVVVKEWAERGMEREKILEVFHEVKTDKIPEKNRRIEELEDELRRVSRNLDSRNRGIVECTCVSLEATRCWNEVGLYLAGLEKGETPENGRKLAADLERCLYHYRRLWRENSKEGDLPHITRVFCWYADVLRETSKKKG